MVTQRDGDQIRNECKEKLQIRMILLSFHVRRINCNTLDTRKHDFSLSSTPKERKKWYQQNSMRHFKRAAKRKSQSSGAKENKFR